MSVNKYSTTPGSNLTVGDGADAVGLQEGMPRADVNNAMRTILADQAKAYIDGAGIVTTGTGSAYLVTTSSDYTAYTAGMNIVVQLHADALVNATVNVNSLGARTLKMRGATGLVNWAAGIAKAGDYVELFYNGTSFYAAGVGSAPVNNGTHTGTTTVGALVATTADINAGTIDGTVIGATTPAAATLSSLVAATADINAGTIDGTVIGATTPAAATFTTADINGGTIDGATVGATAASTGKFTTLQSTGLATLATTDINGGAIDGTVIGATTPAAGTFTTVLGDGSGLSGIVAGITFYRKTANYTAVHQDGVIADTTAGTFTVTLPASPATGDYVVVSDGGSWATTNLTVGRNGKTIEGDAADMTMDLGGVHVTFVYDGFTWQIYVTGAYPSKGIVDNATSTSMTLDAAGNVLVGTTNPIAYSTSTTSGTGLLATGALFGSAAGDAAIFNRRTTDGSIVNLRKDGTTVGIIGTISNDMFLATGVAGIRLTDSVPDIRPVLSDGSNSDATTNLGAGGDRFKDLYLSGGVYLGGIGAANKLDDYEEGTFSGLIRGSGTFGTVVYTNNLCTYTKIGNTVYCSLHINTSSFSGATGTVRIEGFPFTCSTAAAWCAGSIAYTNNFATAPTRVMIENTTTRCNLYTSDSSTNPRSDHSTALPVAEWPNGGDIYMSITYHTV
tara:strand:+ start:23148 stop:25175 length:2028 start_codon:yes stop_codon:yes gene_type:complete